MRRSALFVSLVIFLTGCSAIQKTGYLDNYDSLKRIDPYSKAYLDTAYKYKKDQSINVLESTWAADVKLQTYQKQLYSDHLKQSLVRKIKEKGLFEMAKEGGDLQLETYFSKFDPGNGFLRWFLGMGLGSSEIQVEAKLIEAQSGKVIGSYGYRRKDMGNAMLGLNMSEADDDKQMQNAMDEIAQSFTKFLQKQLPVGV